MTMVLKDMRKVSFSLVLWRLLQRFWSGVVSATCDFVGSALVLFSFSQFSVSIF